MQGISTRSVDDLVKAMGAGCMFKSQVSRLCSEIDERVNAFLTRPLKEVDRSVVKKGRESDEAYTRRVLGKLAAHKDIIVINDEAHHAYRKRPR